MLVIAGPAGPTSDGGPATWVSVLKLLLGILRYSSRCGSGAAAHTARTSRRRRNGWAIEGFTSIKALGAGALLGGVKPKYLRLAVAYLVFALIATIGVAVPIVHLCLLGDRSRGLLDRLKNWMARNNSVIMAVLLLVIGLKLIGDAIAGLST